MEAVEHDNDLIQEILKDNCNRSYRTLFDRHEKLYYKICQKYSGVVNSGGASMNDLLEDKHFVFLKSINSYNPGKKSKFSTY